MIIIAGDLVKKLSKSHDSVDVHFLSWDDGDVYNLFQNKKYENSVPGTLHWADSQKNVMVHEIGKTEDVVRVSFHLPETNSKRPSSADSPKAVGYVRYIKEWKVVPVQIVPVKDELYSRFGGLLETDVFANKRVFIAGQGSGGSVISIELANSGFMYFYLMDHDRLWIGNVMRHVTGISYVGRYKTKAMAQLIKDKNPYAKVYTWEERISWDNVETVSSIVKESDIIVCATDNRPSKLILNRLCVEENKPCIFAGAFRRAYGGQILFVKPNISLCYQCFLMHLPEQAEDEEISNPEHAEELAYTDRPVPIEPGLSTDIKPISVMVAKLIIQELLKDTKTTLRSLDDDLVAPWYLWLNRREIDTQYESLEPLEFNVDGMHVLRWYGVAIERHPGCPVCGNFERF
jgi:molybdopterin/thiamine biosynthesis adenylyltransferase